MIVYDHMPVLLDELVGAVAPADGELIIDSTLGRGGHAEALLEAASCRVVGLDRDPDAIRVSRDRLSRFGDRFVAVQSPFSDLEVVLDGLGVKTVDGLIADLGVSSPQLDDPTRGFSLKRSGPVDMRMDPEQDLSGAVVVNEYSEVELARVLWEYGEERLSRRVARRIIQGRPWTDTVALAAAIKSAVGGKKQRIHPATRSFQAIRIEVNDELGQLRELLQIAARRLSGGGRLAIISFHSLEDRLVKQFIAKASGKTLPRDAYGNPIGDIKFARPKPSICPSSDDPNPRARSARMRVTTRLPWTIA